MASYWSQDGAQGPLHKALRVLLDLTPAPSQPHCAVCLPLCIRCPGLNSVLLMLILPPHFNVSLCLPGNLILIPSLPYQSWLHFTISSNWGFPDSSIGKESACNAEDPSLIPGSGRSPGEWMGYPLQYSWASLVAQQVKNLPAMRETWVQSLGREDHLEKRLAYPLQYCGQENSMDYTVHKVAESDTTDFHVHWISDAIQPSQPLPPFSSCPQTFPASGSFLMNHLFASGVKYWSFSSSTSPSNKYSGLISFRIDWVDLLAVQETLKSLF